MTTYWNHDRVWTPLVNELHELINLKMGISRGGFQKTRDLDPLKDKHLEKHRKAKSLYYDIFNNGGCNYSGTEMRKVFGVPLKKEF